jgi:hypothetical protein
MVTPICCHEGNCPREAENPREDLQLKQDLNPFRLSTVPVQDLPRLYSCETQEELDALTPNERSVARAFAGEL